MYYEQIVHKKTAAALCLTSVKNEDKMEFSRIVEAVKVIILFLFFIFSCSSYLLEFT